MPIRLDAWKFLRDDQPAASQPEFDDSAWRDVLLPHDWSIEDIPGTSSPFSKDCDSGAHGGYSAGGVGWYRHTLKLDPGARHRVTFEGVFGESTLWVNGEEVASHFYGYTPFSVVIPAGLDQAVISLRVANLGEVGRWYTGSGLYRPVELEKLGEVALLKDGLTARAALRDGRWNVEAFAETEGPCEVRFAISSPSGEEIIEGTAHAGPEGMACLEMEVSDPQLWNPWDSPLSVSDDQPLYQLKAWAAGDEKGDAVSVTFGLRDITIDAQEGLKVNGVKTLLKGGCIHHDNGILGACAYDSAEIRKIRLLKQAGFNAIRTSHNPPSKALLDACDREGILVVDEIHDEWELPKRKDSYHRHFPQLAEADAQAMVRRDRSHPSVWCWSIGNEILDCYDRPDIALKLRNAVLACDPTRPITAGLCRPWWSAPNWVDWPQSSEPACRHLDIVGMNYMWEEVRPDHEAHPTRLMMQTETYPLAAWDSWKSVEECPWNLGDFVWTAQDYIGESGIGQAFAGPDDPVQGSFPAHLAICGDLDLIGDRKPQSFHRESLWKHAVLSAVVCVPERLQKPKLGDHWHPNWGWRQVESHWNWPGFEAETLTVEVITSCRKAAVKLNGRFLYEKQVHPGTGNIVSFEVPYEPGVLEISGWDENGREEAIRLITCQGANRIDLHPENPTADLSRQDLLWLGLTLTDEAGVRCQLEDQLISLSVEGPAELLGFGNASMTDTDSLQDPVHSTYLGRALAVLRPTGKGEVIVTAKSEGLTAGEARFKVS